MLDLGHGKQARLLGRARASICNVVAVSQGLELFRSCLAQYTEVGTKGNARNVHP